ncbi:MAG TPA: extracellular solute-binding protein [Candidatus Acidoferrales bacterium]|nr:extracellular solute-binding protein [Candidatus Acidoferrales bacterium]
MKRLLVRLALVSGWASLIFGLFPAAACWAAGHVNMDAARKEGKLTIYSSISLDDINTLARAFEKKYPWIKVTTYRAGKIKLAQRMLTEARAGKHTFDVLLSSAFTTLEMKAQNLLAKYQSPESAALPRELRDPQGFWSGAQINTMSVAYNTKLVRKEDVPRQWRDLLDPKWRGKLAINGNRPEWYIGLLQLMGEEEGRKYMRALADGKTIPIESATLADELLAAGEYPAFVNASPANTESEKKKGAPVDWANIDPLPAYPILVSVSANANFPNTARLMADFLISAEGQKVFADIPRIPARPGIEAKPAHLTKGVNIFYIDVNKMAGKGDDLEAEFRKTFRLR